MGIHSSSMLSLVCVCVLLFIGTDAAPQYGDWYLGPQRAPMQYGDWYLNPTQRAPMQYGDWYLNPTQRRITPQYGGLGSYNRYAEQLNGECYIPPDKPNC